LIKNALNNNFNRIIEKNHFVLREHVQRCLIFDEGQLTCQTHTVIFLSVSNVKVIFPFSVQFRLSFEISSPVGAVKRLE